MISSEWAFWQGQQCGRIARIIKDIEFNDWQLVLTVPHDPGARHGSPYLQVVVKNGIDNVTGEPMTWKGRKWQLSYHMTETEIVRTAFFAVQKAVEHETSEQFKYKGVAPYDPHIKIGDLVALAEKNDLDGREQGPALD